MTCRTLGAAVAVLLALVGSAAAEPKLGVKTKDTPPPKELSEPVRAALDATALEVFDGGKLLCTVWPRKTLESKGTAEQVKNGLTYRELPETVLVGAVQFPDVWTDYRKQKIKPGVYTMRLGFQPMDGDHQGTAPFNEFCLLTPAKLDDKPDLTDAKSLVEMSTTSTTRKHPGIMLLFPNPKPAAAPATEAKPNDVWVVNFGRPVSAGGQKATLGFSLVVVGQTMAE